MNQNVAIIEIRGGTGGEEAKIWARELLKMYTKYAASKGFKVQSLDFGTIKISGVDVFNHFRFEAGVHRVQRIPLTERRGRIHTSTATIAVLPEIPQEQIIINPADLEWQFYRSSTQGGQNVQKVSSAARVIHKPTGIIASSEQERTQEQNRQIALTLLRSKLWEREEEKKLAILGQARSSAGLGMRSEKIRTYNFPQDRLTDHRIGKSWRNLEGIMEGKLDKIIELIAGKKSHS